MSPFKTVLNFGQFRPSDYTVRMKSIPTIVLATAGLLMALPGCSSKREPAVTQASPLSVSQPAIAPSSEGSTQTPNAKPQKRALTPSDFARDPASTEPPTPGRRAVSEAIRSGETPPTDTGAAQVDPELQRVIDENPVSVSVAPLPKGTYTLDAMVGQVNGRAIYASQVLAPMHEVLQARGRRLPRAAFEREAAELIVGRLNEIIDNALILGVAERDLSDQEQMGLQNILQERRQQMLRDMGIGSEKLANTRSVERTGRSIDEELTEERQKIVVTRYLRTKLFPRINVTRRDVARYYRDHQEEFNPPPGRVLRIIRVNDARQADRIDAMLAEGKPFAEVAADRANVYRPEEAGLMPDVQTGDRIFGPENLNEAVLKLAEGQNTGRVQVGQGFWWVHIDKINTAETKRLRDVQLQIEELLKRQRFQQLSAQQRARLFREGSYNPIEQMATSLLDVAMARYAQPE